MIHAMCNNCNEYLKEFNKIFSLDSFWFEHYKTRYCTSSSIDLNDKPISCLTIYGARIKYYAEEWSHNQPERSKREDLINLLNDICDNCLNDKYLLDIVHIGNDSSLECLLKDIKMRCSEHCGNTVRDK